MIETIEHISASELKEKLSRADNRPILVNTLGREAYTAKRIPGSINIPTENIADIEKVVPDREQPIVVYCANADCQASPRAAEALDEMGYAQVWDFEKGLSGWRKAGLPLTGKETG